MLKIKTNGVWRRLTPFAKSEGEYPTVVAGLIKQGSVWKRFYRKVVAPDSLAGWWDFRNNLADYANGVNASKGSTTGYTSALGRTGLRVYSGRHGVIPSFTLGSSWTINIWYHPISLPNYTHLLTDTRSQSNFTLKLTGGAGIPYLHRVSVGSHMASKGIPVNKWSMITFTYDSGTFKIYIDGVLDTTKTFTLPSITGTYYIGRGHQDEYSNGIQSDTMRWTRALTDSEVADLYTMRYL